MSFDITYRKFMRNPLLNRRQCIIDVKHQNSAGVSKAKLAAEIAKKQKVQDTKCISLFGFRTNFGGQGSSGFCLIYDNLEAFQKFEPRYRQVRAGMKEAKTGSAKAKKEKKALQKSQRLKHSADLKRRMMDKHVAPAADKKDEKWYKEALGEREAEEAAFLEESSQKVMTGITYQAKGRESLVSGLHQLTPDEKAKGYRIIGEGPEITSKAFKRTVVNREGEALFQESASEKVGYKHVSAPLKGADMRGKDIKKLSDEEEELYYKFFPEEKPMNEEEISMLETGRTKSFKIRVPVSGGQRLCLTEDTFHHRVRAEPCRKGEQRQRWFWVGSKLKNLASRGRCLGLAHFRKNQHHIQDADIDPSLLEGTMTTAQLAEQQAKEAQKEQVFQMLKDAWTHSVNMESHCSDTDKLLRWEIDKSGRLKSSHMQQCLAINEYAEFSAFVLPCNVQIDEASLMRMADDEDVPYDTPQDHGL